MKTIKLLSVLLFTAGFNALSAQNLSHKLHLTTSDTQCFTGNEFCLVDSIFPKSGVPLKKAIYLFSDGGMTVFNPLLNPVVYLCKSFNDPMGGAFSLTVEIHDSDDNIIKQTYPNLFYIKDCSSAIVSKELSTSYTLNYDPIKQTASIAIVGGEDIQLYDIQGKLMEIPYQIYNNEIRFSTEYLTAGFYTILVYQKDKNLYYPLKFIQP